MHGVMRDRGLWTAVVVLAALGAAVTWPLLRAPATTTLDAWFAPSQLWTMDILARGLLEEGRLIGETTMVAWPGGGYLSIVGWSYLPLLVPAQLLGFGTAAALHVGIWLQLIGAGLACFLLARRLGASQSSALAVGCLYGIHPFALHQLMNGQFTELCHWGPPLLALLLLRLRERPSWRPLAGMAVGFGLLVSSSPYSAATALLIVAALGGWMVWSSPGERGKVAGLLALTAAAMLLGGAPFVLYFVVLPGDSELLLYPNQLSPVEILYRSENPNAALRGWVLPWRLQQLLPAQVDGAGLALPPANASTKEFALGWLSLGLAGLGLARWVHPTSPAPRLPGPRFWLLPALGCALVASGHYLMLGPGQPVMLAGRLIPLPLLALWYAAPASQAFASTYRVALGVLLCVALLSALGLDVLLARVGGWRRTGLAAVATAALVGEGLLLDSTSHPLPTLDIRPLQVHLDLAAMDDDGTVLDVPWWPTHAIPNPQIYVYWQSVHHHPLHHTELGMVPENQPTDFVLGLEQAANIKRPDLGFSSSHEPPAHWIIVHTEALEHHRRQAVLDYVEAHGTLEHSYPEDGVSLYRVDTP